MARNRAVKNVQKEDTSLISKMIKTWATYKATKGVLRVVTGPLALSGIGYYLYRKFKQPSVA